MTEQSRRFRTVQRVWGQNYEIEVYEQSARVWVAVGDYAGDRLEVTDRGKSAVAKLWRDTARHKGKLPYEIE